MNVMARLFIIFTLLFLVLVFGSVAQNESSGTKRVSVSPDEETLIKKVIAEFFEAYPKRDIATAVSLWSAESPDFESHKSDLEYLFGEYKDIVIKEFSIKRMEIEGDGAKVLIFITINATETKTDKPIFEVFGSGNRSLTLDKEDGSWKIFNETSVEVSLASRLIFIKDEQERNRILVDEKDFINVYLARAFTNEGNRLDGQIAPTELVEIYRLGLGIAERIDDKWEIARALKSVGTALGYAGKRTEALESLERALQISEEIGDKEMIAFSLNSIGVIYGDYDFSKALEYYQRSYKYGEELGDKHIMATAFGNIGNIYTKQGNLIKALENHQMALALKRQLNDLRGIPVSLNNIGLVYEAQNNYSQALESYKESIEICKSNGDKYGMAIDLYNAGNIYNSKGDYTRAMAFYTESLELGEEIKSPYGIAGVSMNIANLYNNQGNYAQAIEYFNKGLVLFQKLEDTFGISYAINGLGTTYKLQEDYQKAIEYYQKSIALKEEGDNKDGVVETLTYIGECYTALNEKAKAFEYFEKALKFNESTGSARNSVELEFYILLDIAKIQLSQKNYAEALESIGRAKADFEKIPENAGSWELYTIFGRAFRGLGKTEQARDNFEKAILIVEDLRTKIVGGEEEEQRFFANKVSAYHLMVDLLVSENNLSEAFGYIERAKSRSLLGVLQNGKIDFTKAMTIAEKEEEIRLRNELVSFNAQISSESERPQPDQQELADLKDQLRKKRLEFEEFQIRLYADNPELKIQRGEMKPISLEESARLLPDGKSALLEFVVAEDKSFLFVLTKDAAQKVSLKVYPIDIRQKDLAERTERFRSKLATGDLEFARSAQDLYILLLKPAETQLKGKTNLIIAPDSSLWDLPFQAVQTSDGKYLIEQAAVSYAPSLTALREMAKNTKNKNSSGATLLAFGNPIVGKETTERVQRVFMSEKLEPLPEAERLVNELQKMYGANRSKIFVGDQAREKTAKNESPKYRILQFATHGILNDASPMYSNLVLAQNEKDQNEDGLLEAWEMKDLDLKADMVILSACETARGKISNGEGVIGMSWALFIAGTPTTVAGQWKVESSSTTELMLEFHRQLLSGKGISKAEALRRASLKVMKMPKYSHPSYWAGFVIVGDGR